MNYKQRHLSKFCCKPANELEFEAVRMSAELGGVDWYGNKYSDLKDYPYLAIDEAYDLIAFNTKDNKTRLSVLDFIKKLRMSESEAMDLEDNRVDLTSGNVRRFTWAEDGKRLISKKGYQWQLNEDKTEVSLIKIEK